MKINEQFELTTDSNMNFVLVESYKSKVGTIAKRERYYPTIESALEDCYKLGLLKTELKDIETVIQTINKLHEDIKKALKEVK